MSISTGDDAVSAHSAQQAFCEVFETSAPPAFEPGDVTAIVLSHNEALRLPYFIDHHKKAGVDKFVLIDNASTDETAAIVDGDPAVWRLPTTRAYKDYKSLWRTAIADHYLVGRWVVFLDVDELLVYPGWPDRSIADYCAMLEAHGYDGLHTVMVDMYPDQPLSKCKYTPGEPFLHAAPYFDATNYRLLPYSKSELRRWAAPSARVLGGARERLFHRHVAHEGDKLDAFLLRTLFPLSRQPRSNWLRRQIEKSALRRLRRVQDPTGLPNMSKLSLLRWRRGWRFRGGVHQLMHAISLAPDWGALLHFKYFDDFGPRAEYHASRGQHASGATHYRNYASKAGDVSDRSLMFQGSRRFHGVQDLLDCGLMRDVLSSRNASRQARL